MHNRSNLSPFNILNELFSSGFRWEKVVQLIFLKFSDCNIWLPQSQTFIDIRDHGLVSDSQAEGSSLQRSDHACDVCVVSFWVQARQIYFKAFASVAIDVIPVLRMIIEVVLSVFTGRDRSCRASFSL